ncbi:MAG: hypothetical protein EZS28_021847 [Streblomastix strix]|uniref:Uncharacterized protein n=1 Tax=Streblomastix strix TaxID=222440 RepID=A0A5J4VJ45_9EUKA|nr:MAG: hypothetical protein EZS28_021847 [Streblomastix strix]
MIEEVPIEPPRLLGSFVDDIRRSCEHLQIKVHRDIEYCIKNYSVSDEEAARLAQVEADAQALLEAQAKKAAKAPPTKAAVKNVVQQVTQVEQKSPPITILRFRGTKIDDKLALALKWSLPNSKHIEMLMFNQTEFSPQGWLDLVSTIPTLTLTTISLSGMEWLTSKQWDDFFTLIGQQNLKHLTIRFCKLGLKKLPNVQQSSSATEHAEEASTPNYIEQLEHSRFPLIKILATITKQIQFPPQPPIIPQQGKGKEVAIIDPSIGIQLPIIQSLTSLNLTGNILLSTPCRYSIQEEGDIRSKEQIEQDGENINDLEEQKLTFFDQLLQLLPQLSILTHLSLSSNNLGDQCISRLASSVGFRLLTLQEVEQLKAEEDLQHKVDEEKAVIIAQQGGKKGQIPVTKQTVPTSQTKQSTQPSKATSTKGQAVKAQEIRPGTSISQTEIDNQQDADKITPSIPDEGSAAGERLQIRKKHIENKEQLFDGRQIIRNVNISELHAFVPWSVVKERRKNVEKELIIIEKDKEQREKKEQEEKKNKGDSSQQQQQVSTERNTNIEQGKLGNQLKATTAQLDKIQISSGVTKPSTGKLTAQQQAALLAAQQAAQAALEAAEAERKALEERMTPASSRCMLLIGNRSIQSLSVARNPFGLYGGESLQKAIEVNDTLHSVNLGEDEDHQPIHAQYSSPYTNYGNKEGEQEEEEEEEEGQDLELAGEVDEDDLKQEDRLERERIREAPLFENPDYDPLAPIDPPDRSKPSDFDKARKRVKKSLEHKYPRLYEQSSYL